LKETLGGVTNPDWKCWTRGCLWSILEVVESIGLFNDEILK